MEVLVPVSVGELLDKISILQIKAEKIPDLVKLSNVRLELDALEQVAKKHEIALDTELFQQLRYVKRFKNTPMLSKSNMKVTTSSA